MPSKKNKQKVEMLQREGYYIERASNNYKEIQGEIQRDERKEIRKIDRQSEQVTQKYM